MNVVLKPMSEAVYQAFLERAIREYAGDKVRAGNWPAEESLERARQEFARFLPQGRATPDHYLYFIVDPQADQAVGVLWIGVIRQGPKPFAFIYEIRIEDDYQGRGYGRGAMLAAEEQVKALGLDTLSLHVFGHNTRARALYESLGYEITNLNMTKKLA